MKKIFSILTIIISAAFVLTGCAKFDDGTSVWAKELWLAPTLTGIGSLIFGIAAIIGSKSNSTTRIPGAPGQPDQILDNTGNIPIYKFGQFWFSVVLALATLVIVLMVSIGK